ncbi:MFS transporter [Paenibacillus sp. FSL R7-0216]|uniref:MFS transporter n=1 Tax=Paenibacillus sp. FSL R7-0216 TaxID=2921677 RepID=UPI000F98D355
MIRHVKRGKRSEIHKVAYSSGNLAVNLMSQAFATYLVYYYVDVLGVRPALISLAMVFHGVLNALLNPLFGHLSDRTRTRFGRRLPYIGFGLVPLAAAFALLWTPPADEGAAFPYFIGTVMLYDALFVLVVLNYSALFPEMFQSIKDRAYVSSWRQMLGIVGMIVGVAIPPLLYSQIGWGAMGGIFAALSAVFLALSLWGSRENPDASRTTFRLTTAVRHTLGNRAFVLYVIGSFLVQFTFALLPAGIPFYTKYVLGREESFNTLLLGAIFLSAIPCVFLWGRLTAKYGARQGILIAVACYASALLPFGWVTKEGGAIATAVAVGIGLAGLLVLLDVMLSEVIDEDERRTGARREGMYFGMNGFIVRWGVSLQAACMGLILEASGYEAGLKEQPASAAIGIRWMLSGIPAAALLLALLFFYLYPLGKRQSRS